MKQKYEGIRIVPTYFCNRNCSFCYQKTKSCGFADINKVKSILENIDFIPAYITFMGGELSCFPEETKKLISTVHSILPMIYTKSIITNGAGDLNWYYSLKNDGISRIIFSCYDSKSYYDLIAKITTLSRSAFFTTRVNCYFDNSKIELAKEIVDLCKFHSIPLTLSYDLREQVTNMTSIVKEIAPDSEAQFFDNYAIVNSRKNYTFWIYYHKDYKQNNLIILPDGSTTDDFKDVEDCKGVV